MAHRTRIRIWLLRLITWDGVLPGIVWAVPFLVRLLLPDNRGAIELTAIVLPVVAFLIRYHAGRRHILSNECGTLTRRLQMSAFCLGIALLFLFEGVLVLSHVMPKGAAFAARDDLMVWAVLYALYLPAMAVAMYPGPRRHSDPFDALAPNSRLND